LKNLFDKKWSGLVLKFLFILPFFVALLYLSGVFFSYAKIQFSNISSLESYSQVGHYSGTKSILLMGVEKDENNNEFVDYLSIVVLEDKQDVVKILNINTKYSPYIQKEKEYVPFKSMLVFFKTYYPQENYLDMYLNYVERVFTVKIDGYFIVTKDSAKKLAESLNSVSVSAPSEVNDEDLPGYTIYKGNNNIHGAELIKFVSADANGDNDKLQRQLSTIQSLINNYKFTNLIWHQQPIIDELANEVQSNLNGFDLIKLFLYLKINSPDFRVGYTTADAAIRIENELDERWYTVYGTLDKDIQKVFGNDKIKMEQAKIDVFNSTSVSGLARTKARWLENRGLRVVLVGNTTEKFEKTTIYINTPGEYPNTINEIYNTMDTDDIVIKNEKYDGRSVGDLVIIIGEDEFDSK
jgi:anionic cell wall polymer biosynthesis LytR-Cps2A-Psr (LCP) family protein